jgi:hypothetical protein
MQSNEGRQRIKSSKPRKPWSEQPTQRKKTKPVRNRESWAS